jgi:hypothetical protein
MGPRVPALRSRYSSRYRVDGSNADVEIDLGIYRVLKEWTNYPSPLTAAAIRGRMVGCLWNRMVDHARELYGDPRRVTATYNRIAPDVDVAHLVAPTLDPITASGTLIMGTREVVMTEVEESLLELWSRGWTETQALLRFKKLNPYVPSKKIYRTSQALRRRLQEMVRAEYPEHLSTTNPNIKYSDQVSGQEERNPQMSKPENEVPPTPVTEAIPAAPKPAKRSHKKKDAAPTAKVAAKTSKPAAKAPKKPAAKKAAPKAANPPSKVTKKAAAPEAPATPTAGAEDKPGMSESDIKTKVAEINRKSIEMAKLSTTNTYDIGGLISEIHDQAKDGQFALVIKERILGADGNPRGRAWCYQAMKMYGVFSKKDKGLDRNMAIKLGLAKVVQLLRFPKLEEIQEAVTGGVEITNKDGKSEVVMPWEATVKELKLAIDEYLESIDPDKTSPADKATASLSKIQKAILSFEEEYGTKLGVLKFSYEQLNFIGALDEKMDEFQKDVLKVLKPSAEAQAQIDKLAAGPKGSQAQPHG